MLGGGRGFGTKCRESVSVGKLSHPEGKAAYGHNFDVVWERDEATS